MQLENLPKRTIEDLSQRELADLSRKSYEAFLRNKKKESGFDWDETVAQLRDILFNDKPLPSWIRVMQLRWLHLPDGCYIIGLAAMVYATNEEWEHAKRWLPAYVNVPVTTFNFNKETATQEHFEYTGQAQKELAKWIRYGRKRQLIINEVHNKLGAVDTLHSRMRAERERLQPQKQKDSELNAEAEHLWWGQGEGSLTTRIQKIFGLSHQDVLNTPYGHFIFQYNWYLEEIAGMF